MCNISFEIIVWSCQQSQSLLQQSFMVATGNLQEEYQAETELCAGQCHQLEEWFIIEQALDFDGLCLCLNDTFPVEKFVSCQVNLTRKNNFCSYSTQTCPVNLTAWRKVEEKLRFELVVPSRMQAGEEYVVKVLSNEGMLNMIEKSEKGSVTFWHLGKKS